MTRARDLAAFVSNADGDIKFDTDTLFIDSSANRVGIGTTTPDTILELKGADPILTIRDSATSSGAANATLRLAETGASDTLDQYFDIKANNGQLEFIDNWNEGGGTGTRVVINDSGNVGVKTTSPVAPLHVDSDNGFGNILLSRDGGAGGRRPFGIGITGSADADLTISASADTDQAGAFDGDRVEIVRFLSGGGMTFNGDTAAANAIDDYEEGTWTPVITGSSGSSGQSYSSAIGHYTKVGNMVTVWFSVQLSVEGTHSGSNAILGGLPYTIASGSGTAGGSINFASNLGTNVLGNLVLNSFPSTTAFYINYGDTDSTNPITNTTSLIAGTTRLDGFGTFKAA